MAKDSNNHTVHVDDVVLIPAIITAISGNVLTLQVNNAIDPSEVVTPSNRVRLSDQVETDRAGVVSGPT